MSLLSDNPGLNVNWGNSTGRTALHQAAERGHARVVKVLLAHPDIDVNRTDKYRQTPLLFDCYEVHLSVTQLLLKDPRLDVTLDDTNRRTVVAIIASSPRGQIFLYFF